MTVNHGVVGSSPSWSAKRDTFEYLFFVFQAYSSPLRFTSVPDPLQIRSKSVPYNGRKMGLTRDLQGNHLGVAVKAK